MITPAGPGARNVTVRDLSLDGSRSRGIPNNSGGGIKAGPSWTIRDLHLSNMSYFRVWVYRVADVEVTRNVFDAEFGVSSGHDNIGGGRSRHVTLSSNRFDADTRGNAIDLVAPRDVTVVDNTVTGARGREHSIFLEGVRTAEIVGNRLVASSITLQGNADYRDKGSAVNPTRVRVEGNTVQDAPAHGIAIKYQDEGVRRAAGGNNTVVANEVSNSGLSGIVILHCTAGAASSSDSVIGNTVVNPFARGSSSWGTGCGTIPSNGIAVTGGSAVVTRNSVIDSRPSAVTEFGVYLGAQGGPVPLGSVTVTGNYGRGLLTGITNH